MAVFGAPIWHQDFRAGQMIGSTPRILTYMQLIAVPVGAMALAFMYPLLRDTYGITGEHAQRGHGHDGSAFTGYGCDSTR